MLDAFNPKCLLYHADSLNSGSLVKFGFWATHCGHFTQQVTKMLSILGITTSSSVKSEERNAKIVVLLLSLSGVDIGSTAASCYNSVATFRLLQHYACTMLLIHTCL